MIRVMLVGMETATIGNILGKIADVQFKLIESGELAIQGANQGEYELAILAETIDGLANYKFAEKLVVANPMMNLVLVGSLEESEFHEASEGLGVLGQLDPNPTQKEIEDLLDTLRNILGQLNSV